MSVIRILGISGSPRKDKNTQQLLSRSLQAAEDTGAETRLLNLAELKIKPCQGCNVCIKEKRCPLDEEDDMHIVKEGLIEADGIIFASPSYFGSVPGIMKDMMDRTRDLKMKSHILRDKVASAISVSGLKHGAGEQVAESLARFALTHGMIVVGGCENPINMSHFAIATLQGDKGWRSAKKDEIAMVTAAAVGRRITEVALALQK
ncbi:MAG: flavodoxin family protein [Candidatus Bathyarchaeia archaeon]